MAQVSFTDFKHFSAQCALFLLTNICLNSVLFRSVELMTAETVICLYFSKMFNAVSDSSAIRQNVLTASDF